MAKTGDRYGELKADNQGVLTNNYKSGRLRGKARAVSSTPFWRDFFI